MRSVFALLSASMLVLILSSVAASGDVPTALVYEFADPWTHSTQASTLLEAAGFTVAALPLDQSPFGLDADVIVFGSFVSEHPEYSGYMQRYAADLYNYVDHGHLLVQLTQADQVEAVPPFLPTTHGATRSDNDYARVRVLSPDHTLLSGLGGDDGTVQFSTSRTAWEAFTFQSGFEVLLAADEHAQYPVLMEGAYGQGRILLAAMALDKDSFAQGAETLDSVAFDTFRTQFFANLHGHALDVRARTTRALRVTPSPLTVEPFVPGSWTLAILPDTQVYSLRYPGLFLAQTAWLINNRDAQQIKYVLQLGDIVNNNTHGEWANAQAALELLHGRLPLALVPGNHDYGPSGDASTRDTLMNDYLSYAQAAEQPTFGGAYIDGQLDNTWHRFSAGGVDWIILALEWGPRDEVVAWARGIMDAHPGRCGILITHSFMYNDDTRTDHTKPKGQEHYNPHDYRTPGGVNDGQELWDKLVRHYDFRLVFSGHVLGDGTGYRADRNDTGSTTHQLLANFQMRELGGEAYMRLVEFRPDGAVQVKTYSPLYGRYLLAPDQQFSFILD